jgi:hypothetical protein
MKKLLIIALTITLLVTTFVVVVAFNVVTTDSPSTSTVAPTETPVVITPSVEPEVTAPVVTPTPTETAPSPVATTPADDTNVAPYYATLETLSVAEPFSTSKYSRERDFGRAWIDVDNNGCRTRDDILIRDLTATTMRDECVVTTGTFYDIYTGTTKDFVFGQETSAEAPIDHIYSLSGSWKHGSESWTQEQREAFANDPDNLVVTTQTVNSWKSDKNPAELKATQDSVEVFIGCEYAQRFITVTDKYDLSITASDVAALEEYLATC